MTGGPLNRPESKLNLGVKGQQDQATGTDVGPMLNHTEVDNFEDAGMGASVAKAKFMRGLTQINPANVRGSSNYK